MKTYFVGCCVLFAVAATAQAQQPNDESNNPRPGLISSGPDSKIKASMDAERRVQTLMRIHEYAAHVEAFRDTKAKARTLTRLAALLWDHDKGSANRLFLRAYDSIHLDEQGKESESVRSARGGLPPREWLRLKWEVLGAMSKKDPALSKRLIDEMFESSQSAFSADDRAAMLISLGNWVAGDNPTQAIAFMKQGLAGGKVDGIRTVFTLGAIRAKDAKAADALFVTAVERMVASPHVDAIELLNLGAYLFTSRGQDPANYGEIFNVVIGGVMTPVVSVERPNATAALAQVYLNAAVTILSRQLADPQQKRVYYIAAYQLMPKVQRYIPARAPELANAMTALLPDLPSPLAQDSAFTDLQTTPNLDFEESLKLLGEDNAKATGNEQARDTQCLLLVHGLYTEKDFTGARALVAKVNDAALKSQLTNLINFGEASKLLEQKKVDTAEEMANRLQPGVERAILWLGIARARLDESSRARAAESLNAAVKDARRVEDSRRPFLLLCAASEYARFDNVMAIVTLQESVTAFNKQEDETWERVGFYQEVSTGNDSRPFALSIKGIEPRFSSALSNFAQSRLEQTESILMNLENPALLGAAFVALSTALLK